MKSIFKVLIFTNLLLADSGDYCINQYNPTQEAMHKVIANNNANREFYAKIEANIFQDRVIDLRLKCSKTKNKTIRKFLKDSKEMEELMVKLELLKGVSFKK